MDAPLTTIMLCLVGGAVFGKFCLKLTQGNFIFWRNNIEHNVFRIRILLASPGNLSDDREKVSEIVKYINLDNGQREGFIAEIVSWETHSRPAAGESPQAVLNDQFPDDIDIFVGMMGTYFGTPTIRWGSGTEEEFRIAYERWEKTKTPEIMFYFSDAMSSLSQIDPEQLSKRNSFRKAIGDLGVYYFVYSDITEFQFDLHNHISSAIHEVLKGKEIGQSEEAIPQESASSLKSYNLLLAQDPIINAVSVLDKGADHLNNYNRLLGDLNSDIVKMTRILQKESRIIKRANLNSKPQRVQKSINNIYDGMNDYSKKMTLRIPKLSNEFSGSIMSCLRAVKMVQDNHIEEKLPLDAAFSGISETRAALETLIEAVKEVETGFADWPVEILDLYLQKQIIIALHQDLVASLLKAIELLDKLTDEFA